MVENCRLIFERSTWLYADVQTCSFAANPAMSHTSVSGTEKSLMLQTSPAQKSPASGVSATTDSRDSHTWHICCGVFQQTEHGSFVSKNCSPSISPCPLSGNVLIFVVQVGFVSTLFVKLDQMLSFFSYLESLDSNERKQNLISLPRRRKLRRHWLVAGLLQHLQFWISYADHRDEHVPHSLACIGRVAVPIWSFHKLIRWEGICNGYAVKFFFYLWKNTLYMQFGMQQAENCYSCHPEHELRRQSDQSQYLCHSHNHLNEWTISLWIFP